MTEKNVAFPVPSVKRFSAPANHPGLASVGAGSGGALFRMVSGAGRQ